MPLLLPFLILMQACAEASLSIAAWRILPGFPAAGNPEVLTELTE
jgi:hypothetical protein